MDIYEKDSDKFSREYLAYLGSLDSEVVEGVMRVTKDRGEVVRFEFWDRESRTHFDFPLSGWMNPDQVSSTHEPQ